MLKPDHPPVDAGEGPGDRRLGRDDPDAPPLIGRWATVRTKGTPGHLPTPERPTLFDGLFGRYHCDICRDKGWHDGEPCQCATTPEILANGQRVGAAYVALLDAYDRAQATWRDLGELAIRVEMEAAVARRLAPGWTPKAAA